MINKCTTCEKRVDKSCKLYPKMALLGNKIQYCEEYRRIKHGRKNKKNKKS